MSMTERPVSTRHLVDPEIALLLERRRPVKLSMERLAAARETASTLEPDAPDPRVLFPDVTTTEKRVPGIYGDPEVRLLHYEPRTRPTATAALLWIHGGGFVVGRAEENEALCRRIVTDTGAAVVSVDYRLAPETTEPGQVHDCYAALRWMHLHADELCIDRNRIAVGGASAGGGLAAALAILARDRGQLPVSYQLLIYPMLDDRTSSTVDPHPYAGEFMWTPDDNRFGWTCILGREPGVTGVAPYAAPARVESVADLPPTFISVGALDLFLEEDVDYATRLIQAGVPTELHVYPGAVHGFDMVADARLTQAYLRDIMSALDRHFNR